MWSPKFGGAAYVIGPGSLGSTHGPSQPRSEMDPFASTTFSQNHVLQAQPPETRWHLQTAPNQAINDSETSDIHTRQPSRLAVMQSPTCQCCTVRSANRPLRLRRRQDPVSASLAPSSMSPRPTRSCRDPPHIPREVVPQSVTGRACRTTGTAGPRGPRPRRRCWHRSGSGRRGPSALKHFVSIPAQGRKDTGGTNSAG